MSAVGLTSSQTIGPFYEDALLREDARRNVLAGTEAAGERLRIEGRVLDGDGEPVPDALVEIWQADAEGRYSHPLDRWPPPEAGFLGFGRSGTDAAGRYRFETIKPGRVAFGEDGWQAPHIVVTVSARGLLNHLVTRLYFEDETTNGADPVLQRLPAERRDTLLARRDEGGEGAVYRFDVVLQGRGETAFFNI